MRFRDFLRVGTAFAAMLFASVLSAHHSTAGEDESRTLVAKGVIKEVSWTSPHALFVVARTDESGNPVVVRVTAFAPGLMAKQGFVPRDFRPGSEVELYYHPNRNDDLSGVMVKIVIADGRELNGGSLPTR